MFKKRALPALILMTSLGTAALAATFAPQEAQAEGYCDKFKKAKVKAACAAGDNTEDKMKAKMKAWQKAAKDAADAKGQDGAFKDGTKIKCSACHESSNGGDLKAAESEKYWAEFAALSGG
jgi:hypothetical protein